MSLAAQVREQARTGVRQFAAHLGFAAHMAERGARDLAQVRRGQPHEQRSWPHLRYHRVGLVDRRGAARDQPALAAKCQGRPAIGADLAVPPAVVHLAQRGKHPGALVTGHLQDGREILEHQDALGLDPAQQAAMGVLGAVLCAAWQTAATPRL